MPAVTLESPRKTSRMDLRMEGERKAAYEEAARMNRKPKGERFSLKDLFGRGPGLGAGEL